MEASWNPEGKCRKIDMSPTKLKHEVEDDRKTMLFLLKDSATDGVLLPWLQPTKFPNSTIYFPCVSMCSNTPFVSDISIQSNRGIVECQMCSGLDSFFGNL